MSAAPRGSDDATGREAGQATAEYVAVLVLVAALVGTLATTGVAGRVEGAVVAAFSCLTAQGCSGAGDVAAGTEGGGPVGTSSTPADPLEAPLVDVDATLAALQSGEVDLAVWLDSQDVDTRGDLVEAAERLAGDATATVPTRYGANRVLLQAEADRLRAVLDRDGAGLETWEELEAMRQALLGGRQVDADRYAALVEQVEAAPPGSLLAGLAETDALRGQPLMGEGLDTVRDVHDRVAAVRRARDRQGRFARWAASGRQFLWFDPSGDGRVAEVVGDLGNATHVPVIVPGTGSRIDNHDRQGWFFSRQLDKHLQEQIVVQGLDATTAVIACQCYDAPDNLVQARDEDRAVAGAEPMTRFVIDALSHADDPVATMVGYSYGSPVMGRAFTDEGLVADHGINVGSPGMGGHIQRVEDLDGAVGELFSPRHDQDPIRYAFPLGPNPDREEFGSSTFDVGDADYEREWFNPVEFEFHGVYWLDQTSLDNMALVSLGLGERTAGYREGRP